MNARRVSKRYGSTLALAHANLEVQVGEIHGLLGHNGSGKSTLIKILAGVIEPDSGAVEVFDGRPDLPLSPATSRRLGLRFVHQNLGLIPTLTVGENLMLDRFTVGRVRPIYWSRLHAEADKLLASYDLRIRTRARVSELSPTERGMVAIIRAAARRPGAESEQARQRLLVLDEPTVFLPRKEVGELFTLLRRLVLDGDSVILVSHRMTEILEHADRVTVLRDGRTSFQAAISETTEAELIGQIAGDTARTAGVPDLAPTSQEIVEAASSHASSGTAGGAQVRVRIVGLVTHTLREVNLDLRAGEILGVTGLVGSGYEDVLYALFGCLPGARGRLEIDGGSRAIERLTPVDAMKFGIGLIPGDRAQHGIAGSLTIEENLTIGELGRYFRGGVLRGRALLRASDRTIADFGIRPANPRLPAEQLSGGNQQRVVVAKWLTRRPRVILLHELTQGVDVGARAAIWSFIHEIARQGTTVLCATTDHEELTALATRIAVFGSGRLTRILEGSDITKERISAETLAAITTASRSAA